MTRVPMTGPPGTGADMAGRRLAILASFALARIGFGFQIQTVGSLGSELRAMFHLDYASLGALIGIYMLAGAFVALPLGLLGRRFGDGKLVGAGLALMAVGAVVSATGDSIWGGVAGGWGGVAGGPAAAIAAGRMISGIGAVAMIVMQGKVMADWFKGRSFLIAISISIGAYPIGLGLSQLLNPALLHAFGWRAPFWAGAGVMTLVTVLFVAAYRAAPGLLPVPRRFSMPSGRECLLVIVAGLIWTAYTTGYTSYLSYLPSLMAARGDGLVLTGIAMTIATWGNVPGTVAGGALVQRFGGLRIFLVGTLSLVIGMVATGIGGSATGWAVLIGVLGSAHASVIVALGTLSARPENRAVGMGLFYTAYYGGNSVGPAICGWAADRMGTPAGAMLAAAALSSVALPIYFLHRRLTSHALLLARA